MATNATTTTTTTAEADHMDDTVRTELVQWSTTLADTERKGRAAILATETEAFTDLLDKLHAFGSFVLAKLAPVAATILSKPIAGVTGDDVRAAMARKGSALHVDDDVRRSFPSASTMSRAMVIAQHDTAERRAQWLDASITDDKGNVTRNPRRVQDYVQVIGAIGGNPIGNKSAIDWAATVQGARIGAGNKLVKSGRAPITIGVMARKSPPRDTSADVSESTDVSVIIPTAWRDLFAMDDTALTAVADDPNGFDVSGYSDADRLILARQLLAAIVLRDRAEQRVAVK